MGTIIKNKSAEPSTIPAPFNKVVKGLGSVIYSGSPADVLALLPSLTNSFDLVEIPDALATSSSAPSLPSVSVPTATYVVGNSLSGDTYDQCTYLDTGDGSGVRSALAASAALFTATGVRSVVVVRPGRYTMAATAAQLSIPEGVTLRGFGKRATVFVAPSTATAAWRAFSMAAVDATLEDVGIELPVIDTVGGSTALKGAIEVTAQGCAVRRVRVATVTTAMTTTIEQWFAGVVLAGSGAVPLDVDVQDLDVEYLAASLTVGSYFTFHAVASNAETRANTGSTRGARFARVSLKATAGAGLSRDSAWFTTLRIRQDLAFEADGVTGIDTDEAAYVVHNADSAVTTLGPKIRNVEHQLPAGMAYASASVRVYCRSSNASTLQGVLVDGVRSVDRSTGARAGEFMPINVVMHATWTGTLQGVQVDHVDGEDNTASGGLMGSYLAPLGACTVTDVVFDNIRLRGRSTAFVAGYSTGTLTGVKLQGIKAGTIAIGSSNTNAIAIGMQGTLTDSGTTTAKSANN